LPPSLSPTGKVKNWRSSEELKRLQEREDWQEKLLREKKTIDGIIEGSPIPTFVINNEHKVILWNRACIELTGYTAEEMLGTENHYKPFYSVQRPVIADLIINRDIEGLSKYYGSKKVKQSDKVLGAYEQLIILRILTAAAVNCIFWPLPFTMKKEIS